VLVDERRPGTVVAHPCFEVGQAHTGRGRPEIRDHRGCATLGSLLAWHASGLTVTLAA
jgi:hypothetical protein